MNLRLPMTHSSTPLCIYDISDMTTTIPDDNTTLCSHCPACTNARKPTFRLPKNDRHPHDGCLQAWPICLFQMYYLTGTVHANTPILLRDCTPSSVLDLPPLCLLVTPHVMLETMYITNESMRECRLVYRDPPKHVPCLATIRKLTCVTCTITSRLHIR